MNEDSAKNWLRAYARDLERLVESYEMLAQSRAQYVESVKELCKLFEGKNT